MSAIINDEEFERIKTASELKGSFLRFTRVFFPLLTGRDFIVSHPVGRESHHITIARALTRVARLQVPSQRLMINIAPGHGKSVMLCMWVAWCMAQYPDSNFLYLSYAKNLAAKHTEFIKRVMSLRHYQYLFDVHMRHDSKAKDLFRTTAGGSIGAYGSAGAITGQDAGLPGLERFSGAIIMDDMHKPDEVHSDTIRQGVIDNYSETIQQRARGINVPFVFIGQRLHEDDLPAYLLDGKDGYDWEPLILKSIDDAGNALYPEAFPIDMLKKREETDIYVFASQFQQDPQPAGGAIFKPEWFFEMDEEPEILQTFITADTAETDKDYNDATVFSFWGIYKINEGNRETEMLGLHWLDMYECRVEPKDLEDEFLSFWADCMRHKIQPSIAAIEKKSTGVTLSSILSSRRGLQVRDIKRTRASGSKTQRFLEIQPLVAAKRISFTEGAKHMPHCIEQLRKITANDTHRHDDIADTLYDAVKIALIDKTLYVDNGADQKRRSLTQKLSKHNQRMARTRDELWHA